MESNEKVSIPDKQIRCKPRGLKQYRKRLALSGENRYHPFKSNTKPKVCLSGSKQASQRHSLSCSKQASQRHSLSGSKQASQRHSLSGSKQASQRHSLSGSKQASLHHNAILSEVSECVDVQQLSQEALTPPPVLAASNPSERENPSCSQETSSKISECSSSKHSTQSSNLAQTAYTFKPAEAYLLLLKAENGISIFGKSGCVVVLKDYQIAQNKLNSGKYVLIQRRAMTFLHGECHWMFWCSCDNISARQISSLNRNVNMSIDELQRLYADCIHIKAARKVYRKYDQDNGIEALDDSCADKQGADHRYVVSCYSKILKYTRAVEALVGQAIESIVIILRKACEELFEVPAAKLLVCRRGGFSRFGLVDKNLKCIICKKECEHSRLCRDVKNRGAESVYFELMTNLCLAETADEYKRESSYKKAVISFKKIPYMSFEILCEGLRNLQNANTLLDILLPDLDNCPNCNGTLERGDPVLMGWIAYENVVIVTNTSLKRAKVYYRPCQECGAAAVFEGQSKCLLNLGTYLVGYDVLRSYMHNFLHGRRPLSTFYETWCDIHLDYGNSNIQEEFSYQKFHKAWHTFLSLLDINYTDGFSCSDCGGDDGPRDCYM